MNGHTPFETINASRRDLLLIGASCDGFRCNAFTGAQRPTSFTNQFQQPQRKA